METVISDAPPSQSAIAAVKDKHEAEMGMSKVLFWIHNSAADSERAARPNWILPRRFLDESFIELA
jgi:hypothetical protein